MLENNREKDREVRKCEIDKKGIKEEESEGKGLIVMERKGREKGESNNKRMIESESVKIESDNKEREGSRQREMSEWK